MSNKLKKTITTAFKLNSNEALKTIIEAITESNTDEIKIEQAVNQVVNNYESQMRIFMIALGKEKLKRIFRLIELSSNIEEALYHYSEIGDLDPKDLVAYYGQLNRQLKSDQDFVKTVIDQRLEILNATSSMKPPVNEIIDDGDAGIINNLDPTKRDRVRRLIEGVLENNKVDEE